LCDILFIPWLFSFLEQKAILLRKRRNTTRSTTKRRRKRDLDQEEACHWLKSIRFYVFRTCM
jgi:hypothetical protein